MKPVYWMLLAHGELPSDYKSRAREVRLEILRYARKTGSLEELIDNRLDDLPEELQRIVRGLLEQATPMALLWSELREQGAKVISVHDLAYPERLKKSLKGSTPPILYVLGEENVLQAKRSISIIGSRNALPEAKKIARHAGEYFGREDYVVVTGMARGVDQEAVKGALQVGGKVVGVLPFGILSRKDLIPLIREYHEDIFGGRLTLISDLFPKASWKAQYAMARNRLVVGLSEAVLVVQSGLKESLGKDNKKHQSGTWNAVEQAHRMGKRVYVVDLPLEGNRSLIKQGLGIPLPIQDEGPRFSVVEDQMGMEHFQLQQRQSQDKAGMPEANLKGFQPPLFERELPPQSPTSSDKHKRHPNPSKTFASTPSDEATAKKSRKKAKKKSE
ncbi:MULTISPECIES: DNA-processing protein DprA [unclassified Meiothermus]|uniref:DNA-processing protein DprA n=1 Tax=unclassified Meiothermus TaxID=370471 RepID=UPI000D7CD482|nr:MULTISPECIES: DNA-processing protein DprA [unclassified Meiothermus]PZA06050.1 hypothetical protein DNA98_15450 [Meiothermus sp. Pnk-1]RYM36154.1 hypothetical protein EWH23_11100 [Meiothermus sp. PNK-Is4]